MKSLWMLALIGLTGCQQLQHGETQPVRYKNIKEKIFLTTCSGAVETWADCYNKAKLTCDNGYKIIQSNENAQGGIRTFEFQCKN